MKIEIIQKYQFTGQDPRTYVSWNGLKIQLQQGTNDDEMVSVSLDIWALRELVQFLKESKAV